MSMEIPRKNITELVPRACTSCTTAISFASPSSSANYVIYLIQTQFKYQKFREPEIKAGFEEYCSERLRDLVSRAGTGKNTWMEASVFEEMLAYRGTEKFKIRSETSKKNRASKGKNGKAPGTHTMGRLNSIQFMDKLCNDNGGLSLPPPEELMKKSKTKKSGGYVCDEVSDLLGTIKKKKEALLETLTKEEIDDMTYILRQ